MGRKSRSKNESEHLRGIIRALESENKKLRKQVQRADRELQKAVDFTVSFLDESSFPTPANLLEPLHQDVSLCPKCKAKLKVIELGPKNLYTCSNDDCKYRRTVKS